MEKFTLPWEEEPVATVIRLFGCTVQHMGEVREEVNEDGDSLVEDNQERG